MNKGTIHQERFYGSKYIYSKHICVQLKQILLGVKSQINSNLIVMGNFSSRLSPIDRSSQQKLNRNI